MYISVYFFGTFIGGITLGPLCDRYGRKRMWVLGSFAFTIFSTVLAWLPSLESVLALRFLQGAVQPHAMAPGYTAAMESCEVRHRATLGLLFAVPWAFGTMLVGALAYLIPYWRNLQMAAAVPMFVLLPLLWFYDESPRWLLVRGRQKEARKVLEKAARWNGVSLPDEEIFNGWLQAAQESAGSERTVILPKKGIRGVLTNLLGLVKTYLLLILTPTIRKITLLTCFCWFTCALVFYGLSLSPAQFGGNPYVYMVLTGLVELPAYTVSIFAINKFGRRLTTSVCFFVTGISLLLMMLVPEEMAWPTILLALIGKLFLSTAYQSEFLFATELFPTSVRSTGISTGNFMARLATLFPPYVILLTSQGFWYLPSTLYGIFSIAAGIASLFFPETCGRPLAETVHQLETEATS